MKSFRYSLLNFILICTLIGGHCIETTGQTSEEIANAEANLINLGEVLHNTRTELDGDLATLKDLLPLISASTDDGTVKKVVDSAISDLGTIGKGLGFPGASVVSGLIKFLFDEESNLQVHTEIPSLDFDTYIEQLKDHLEGIHDQVNTLHDELSGPHASEVWNTTFQDPITDHQVPVSVFGQAGRIPNQVTDPTAYTQLSRSLEKALIKASWRHFVRAGFHIAYIGNLEYSLTGKKYPYPVCLQTNLPRALADGHKIKDQLLSKMNPGSTMYAAIADFGANGGITSGMTLGQPDHNSGSTWAYYNLYLVSNNPNDLTRAKTLASYLFREENVIVPISGRHEVFFDWGLEKKDGLHALFYYTECDCCASGQNFTEEQLQQTACSVVLENLIPPNWCPASFYE